ncbi:MAG: hypothetical protein GX941_08705 [Candidatus Methanofastidiosa archaeon]|nr:hypothetical protein [Candidatus Methanofastidiosa archaeon]
MRKKEIDKKLDDNFPVLINSETTYGKKSQLYKELKSFIYEILSQQKQEILESLEEIIDSIGDDNDEAYYLLYQLKKLINNYE